MLPSADSWASGSQCGVAVSVVVFVVVVLLLLVLW